MSSFPAMKKSYHALALFSGGLDSLLAVRMIQRQGLDVLGLHFTSPFFGHPGLLAEWQSMYGVELLQVDVGQEYIDMMRSGPVYGFGKVLNPCINCKILMLRRAKQMMAQYGAQFIISGEVVGQRPMSQRRDALNSIRNEAEVGDVLLRPLCARQIDPTPVELSGLVDREKLGDMRGRGRKDQLALAKEYGFVEIPAPAGGCRLTEKESAKRYFDVFRHMPAPVPEDFDLANTGRQYWSGPHWLSIGRNEADNDMLEKFIRPTDLLFRLADHPGPLALGRQLPGTSWSEEVVRDAAAFTASFSPKARKSGGEVDVLVVEGGEQRTVSVLPSRTTETNWTVRDWESVRRNKTSIIISDSKS
ncbi:MAG: tRNA(5-methylaminomethyl-2-thiouridylate) methyltransferase [Desulfovibrio sp.]|uniref:tRNA(5-methylaminomethyl-2-thiouridylate) methyltransferase n=1 Tax=Desulfovibrio sp. 7SRBS1 TaxID=3378064 RepID=UPI003B3F0DDF